jgi:hypothetical protein
MQAVNSKQIFMHIASIFSLFIIAAPLTIFAYGQASQMDPNRSNVDNANANANTLNIQDIPAKKFKWVT